jgi:hypothetical protein
MLVEYQLVTICTLEEGILLC